VKKADKTTKKVESKAQTTEKKDDEDETDEQL